MQNSRGQRQRKGGSCDVASEFTADSSWQVRQSLTTFQKPSRLAQVPSRNISLCIPNGAFKCELVRQQLCSIPLSPTTYGGNAWFSVQTSLPHISIGLTNFTVYRIRIRSSEGHLCIFLHRSQWQRCSLVQALGS
jgi:hypothetical protein